MNVVSRGLALVIAVTVASAPALAGPSDRDRGEDKGKIDRAREEMKRDSDDANRVRDHRDQNDDDDDDDGDDDELCDVDCDDEPSLGDQIALFIITTPFWLPSGLLGDWPTARYGRRYRFRSYPFADGGPGQFTFVKRDRDGEPVEPYPWELQLRTVVSYERHDAAIDGRRIQGALRTNRRWGFQGELTRYDEELGAGVEDHLWHWELSFSYSFAVSPLAHMHAGIGGRGLRFAAGDYGAGTLFRYGFEVLPTRPLRLFTTAELGNIDDSFAFELDSGAGVVWNRFEIFVGYRLFRIAGINFAGPQLGVAIWM